MREVALRPATYMEEYMHTPIIRKSTHKATRMDIRMDIRMAFRMHTRTATRMVTRTVTRMVILMVTRMATGMETPMGTPMGTPMLMGMDMAMCRREGHQPLYQQEGILKVIRRQWGLCITVWDRQCIWGEPIMEGIAVL